MNEFITKEQVLKANTEDVDVSILNGEARIELESLIRYIDQLPTAADVASVVHGRWVHDVECESWYEKYVCSICDHHALLDGDCRHELSNYCPNCGAKMDGKAGGNG